MAPRQRVLAPRDEDSRESQTGHAGRRKRRSRTPRGALGRGSGKLLRGIGSPYGRGNPRKQRARSGGNIWTSRRIRPEARGPEVGRCQRKHPKKFSESQGSKRFPTVRRSSDLRDHRVTARGQALPRREGWETAAGEGKASKGARVEGNGRSQRIRKDTRAESRKLGEPQDWLRGATNPQGLVRSKPSRR